MSFGLLPSRTEIQTVFVDEIDFLGGHVVDTFAEGDALFQRAVLPVSRDVRSDDKLHGGVALRTRQNDVIVHPYLYREVCRNGMIMADTLASKRFRRAEFCDDPCFAEDVMLGIRSAIHDYVDPQIHEVTIARLRTSTSLEAEANLLMQLLSMRQTIGHQLASELVRAILAQFHQQADPTVYGAINAVTAVARTVADEESRWDLEELGGAILCVTTTTVQPDIGAALPPPAYQI